MTPDQMAAVDALIEEAEKRPGSSMYCKVTTYELRKALGQDVSGWIDSLGHRSGAVRPVSVSDTLDPLRAQSEH